MFLRGKIHISSSSKVDIELLGLQGSQHEYEIMLTVSHVMVWNTGRGGLGWTQIRKRAYQYFVYETNQVT